MVPQFPPSGVGSLPLPQPPLRGASPIPPPLLLPLRSPHAPHPTWSLGVPPVPLGVRGPPPVPGRCPGCEKTGIPHPPKMHKFWLLFLIIFYCIFFDNLNPKQLITLSQMSLIISETEHALCLLVTCFSPSMNCPWNVLCAFFLIY